MQLEDPPPLEVVLRPVATTLRLPAGHEVSLEDAVLSLRNVGREPLWALSPELTLTREGAVLYRGADALLPSLPGGRLEPGTAVEWGLYGLLQSVDKGFAGRVHLFGLKAAVNWDFGVEVSATWRRGTKEEGAAFAASFRWRQDNEGTRVELKP